MTSREAAIIVFGQADVEAFGRVKSFMTRFGNEIEKVYAEAVGGERGKHGSGGPDIRTRLGDWEFCASENSKNASGRAADRTRVPEGHLVQVTGPTRKGYIMGEEFLRRHGVDEPHRTAGELLIKAMRAAAAA